MLKNAKNKEHQESGIGAKSICFLGGAGGGWRRGGGGGEEGE